MGNRIEMDPSSDPEQDIHSFVSEGIDHAGLLALCAPRPTLICSATLDFFPIEGARESFNEARKLFELAGAGEKIAKAEAENRHSLSKPLREAVYGWFGHWLAGEPSANPSTEIAITPRADIEMQSSPDGQVSVSFQSKNLLAIASEEFSSLKKPPEIGLRQVLQLDQEMQSADPLVAERGVGVEKSKTLILFVNGNEAEDWREAGAMVKRIHEQGYGTVLIEPRGMGRRRQPGLNSKLNYTDPVSSIEANIAYNASMVGRSLLGMRVADLIKAIEMMIREYKPEKFLLCGSGDAALVALFAADCEPRVAGVILENLLPSYEKALSPAGFALSEANLVPGIMRSYGDIPKVLSSLRPRPVLITSVASPDEFGRSEHIEIQSKSLATSPQMGGDWLRKHFGA
jgi:pimeloyl-ACP methyl ester carboxylesterase